MISQSSKTRLRPAQGGISPSARFVSRLLANAYICAYRDNYLRDNNVPYNKYKKIPAQAVICRKGLCKKYANRNKDTLTAYIV